jgi:hypothetical protein
LGAVLLVCLHLQGRAIATFGSRRQAHDAIRRLHGKETLAGVPDNIQLRKMQQQAFGCRSGLPVTLPQQPSQKAPYTMRSATGNVPPLLLCEH